MTQREGRTKKKEKKIAAARLESKKKTNICNTSFERD